MRCRSTYTLQKSSIIFQSLRIVNMKEEIIMGDICLPVLSENEVKQRSIFILNDSIQVAFITDLKTGKKLDDDYNVNEYLQAVVQANLLKVHGISDPEQIVTIVRSEEIEDDKVTVVISLDVVTNVQDGFDELRCSISEDSSYFETEEGSSEGSSSWNQQVSESTESEKSESLCAEVSEAFNHLSDVAPGPILRWNSEMTTQLIKVRGEMDSEFMQAKYKFRLWEHVAVKLNEILENVHVTAKDCDDKWRNIMATYRKNIDKIKCCGDNAVRWEYFNAMDNILKGTKELANESPQNALSDLNITNLLRSLEPINADVLNKQIDSISVSDDSSPFEEIGINDLDDPQLDCIVTRKFNEDRRIWTTDQCLLLIHLRRQMESKFIKSPDKAFQFWREIASQMNMNFLSDFAASELESVWNHCSTTYEINLENLKSKGVNTVNWKYFAVMDEIRGGTREIAELCVPRPGENLVPEFAKLCAKHPSLIQSRNTDIILKYETDTEDISCSHSGIIWTQGMVKMLISLKKVIEQDIMKHKIPRKKQWWTMVRRFRALKNVHVTEEVCEEKWRNLVRTYKKNLVRVKKKGIGVIRWQYFWRMHEILGNRVLENENQSVSSMVSSNKIIKSVDVPQNSLSTLPLSEQFIVEESQDKMIIDLGNDESTAMINGSRLDEQNQMLREIIDQQSKKIEDLHREQLNIKSLLTQLLQKLS